MTCCRPDLTARRRARVSEPARPAGVPERYRSLLPANDPLRTLIPYLGPRNLRHSALRLPLRLAQHPPVHPRCPSRSLCSLAQQRYGRRTRDGCARGGLDSLALEKAASVWGRLFRKRGFPCSLVEDDPRPRCRALVPDLPRACSGLM